MKKIIFLLFVCFSLLSCSKKDKSKVIYSISNAITDSVPLIKISMKFQPDDGEITKLRFQDKAWGEEELYNSIQKMKLLNTKGTVVKNKDSNWIQITHPKGVKELHFEYFLKQDITDDEAAQNRYRPIIYKDYFHIFSHNMFMLPDHFVSETADEFDIVLDWNNFPENYTIHNSFGSEKRKQQIEDVTEEEFHSAIFVGGDFRIHKNEIENNQLVFATRGNWIPFKDSTVSDLLYRTVKAQRNFWKDHSQKYFTVTMMPFPQKEGSSFGGTGLTNSFATSVSNNDQSSIEQLRYLFNHELMHNWIGHAIKNENEEEQYWFSEGFTDYYTQKNIAKNKILKFDEENFIEEMNVTIKNLFSSPVADKPNDEITYDNFWSDRNYEKLPYYRGTVFAFLLDLRIKKDSDNKHSLDDVMRDLFTQSKKDKKLNSKMFVETVNKFTETNIDDFFKEHIIEGQLFDLKTVFSDFDLEYSSKATIFDQGFSYDKEARIVTQVDPNSEAYAAGLRADDVLGGWSIYYGNIDKEIELKVNREGTQETITYLPIKEIDLPQLLINEDNVKKINL
ncbi:M1 family aminopeptidase [uncultured Aquimarina sp.]|uniref:M1 family aminopeptidase n=1 Tax=uncultured Aquimarina sp. TaxID=575652 RepID=UPI00260A27B1|nr:M1 family aminopeptidase [uncultured Aquimarina sp.]